MSTPQPPHEGQSRPSEQYEIHLKGHLNARWSDWLNGLKISPESNGNTRLTGPITDQAALHGLLAKIRDLGIPLISLTRIAPHQSDKQQPPHPQSTNPQSTENKP